MIKKKYPEGGGKNKLLMTDIEMLGNHSTAGTGKGQGGEMQKEGILYFHIYSGSKRQSKEYVAQCSMGQGI